MKEVGRMKTKELNKGEIIITSQDLHKPIYEELKPHSSAKAVNVYLEYSSLSTKRLNSSMR